MKIWIFCIALSFFYGKCCLCQERPDDDDEDMRKRMMDQTKKAILSYDVVEERASEIIYQIEKSTFGDYAKNVAAIIPFVTGKIEFHIQNLDFSYSHFSEKANIDYRLTNRWKVFIKREHKGDDIDERSGVKYSFRF